MHTVGDAQLDMSLLCNVGGKVDLCHVHSGGCSVTHVPGGNGGEEEDMWYVHCGGHLVTPL